MGFWAKLWGREQATQKLDQEAIADPVGDSSDHVRSYAEPLEMTGTTTVCAEEVRALFASRRTVDGGCIAVAGQLVREPDNPADPNAVGVHVEGACVGYLPGGIASHAPIDPDEAVSCQVQMWGTVEEGKLRTRGWVSVGSAAPAWPFGPANPPPLTRHERRQASAAATSRMVDQALAEGGRRAAEIEDGMIGRYHYLETVEPIKQLKREGRLQEALTLCYAAIEGAERDREGREPAPWYTEQAAIIHRKLGDRDAEIAVLTRWLRVCPPGRREGSRIAERLGKLEAKRAAFRRLPAGGAEPGAG